MCEYDDFFCFVSLNDDKINYDNKFLADRQTDRPGWSVRIIIALCESKRARKGEYRLHKAHITMKIRKNGNKLKKKTKYAC